VIRFVPALSIVAALGCTSATQGTIQIITDEEAGTFTESPAPTRLQIIAVESADASTVLATASLPATTIDLGQLSANAAPVSINVSGLDRDGTRRVFGASLPVQYGALANLTLPIFVQRTGELARLPGPLSDSRAAPTLAVIQGEYLLVAGGSDASRAKTTQLFDFGAFGALGTPPPLPRVPKSIALYGTVAWLIDETGASYFDFSNSDSVLDVPVPPMGAFADVAGGATVIDSNGAQYIVGGTRASGSPSAKVLKIDPNDTSNTKYPYGNPSWLTLATPRLGAAAAWVDGFGLVVAGGNAASATDAPGIEVVRTESSTGSPLPFPADPTTGAGAAALDAHDLLLAGGATPSLDDPGIRAIDLDCTPSSSSSCSKTWATLPFALASAQAFAWTASEALVVGNQVGSKGTTYAFRLTPKSATEVPTRTAHSNARAVWSPVGTVVLFGGANVIESFTP
jgi:hypothetical protein